MNTKSFGEAFNEIRILSGMSLRKFCDEMENKGFPLNSGNWSRIERGLTNPPADENFYNAIMQIFDLSETEKNKLFSIAKATKILPKELHKTELMEHMPVMLRKIDGKKLTEEEIDELIKWVEGTVKQESDNTK